MVIQDLLSDDSTMNRQFGNISKALALLAVLLLPLQQLFAATCCCRQGNVATRTAQEAEGCCSSKQASCCDRTSTCSRTCCQSERPDGNSKNCRCLVCGLSVDTVSEVESLANEVSSSEGDVAAAVSTSCAPIRCDRGSKPFEFTEQPPSLSAADRCAVLCRYRF